MDAAYLTIKFPIPQGARTWLAGYAIDIANGTSANCSALRPIIASNQALIHATDENSLVQQMWQVVVQVGGYRMAWIGYARNDATRSIEHLLNEGDYWPARNAVAGGAVSPG